MKEITLLQSGEYKNWEVFIFMIVSLLAGFIFGYYLSSDTTFTKNMEDCIERGGKYYLSIKDKSSWNYERCNLDKEINY
jgi:hypothetical protein